MSTVWRALVGHGSGVSILQVMIAKLGAMPVLENSSLFLAFAATYYLFMKKICGTPFGNPKEVME